MELAHQRQCSRCGGLFAETFFRKSPDQRLRAGIAARRYVCIGCEQTARDEKKGRRRSLVKANNAIRSHARTYVRKGLVSDQAAFAERYDWHADQLAHDIEHAAANGCPYCRRAYADMAHGLADVTLDIIDPRAEPYYRTNVRWVCSTCNKAKQDLSPERWGEQLQAWQRWEHRQHELGQAEACEYHEPRPTGCLFCKPGGEP